MCQLHCCTIKPEFHIQCLSEINLLRFADDVDKGRAGLPGCNGLRREGGEEQKLDEYEGVGMGEGQGGD